MLLSIAKRIELTLLQLARGIVPLLLLPFCGSERSKQIKRRMSEYRGARKSDYIREELNKIAHQGGQKTVKYFFENSPKKKSDTVFILGSGFTLADITDEQWRHIEQHDSIGFNFSLVHDFIPDVYFVEGMDEEHVPHSEPYHVFLKHIKAKQSGYGNIPLFILYEYWCNTGFNFIDDMPANVKSQVIWNVPINIRTSNKEKIRSALRSWNQNRKDNGPHVLIAHGGSVGLILSFAVLQGYKEIVLSGVDLVGNTYFWELIDDLKNEGPYIDPNIKVHLTADPKSIFRKHSVTMDEYIKIFNEEILQPEGITLKITSDKSKLANDYPLYHF